ncbi:MAG: hypothetical protein DHS80DRAFT_29248 [Piptocephalis tieghemiana]|nr:MAG: hypothetical protein DHS80DRAFT_29248 [Piptocephalis tieghemiana]
MYQNGLQYALFFLLIFIFMFSIWDNERGEEAVLKELELLQKERALLDNMTLTTNRSAVVPPKVDSVVDTMMTNLTGPSYEDRYYRNVSGIYQGSWLPTSLPENTLSYNETLTESFDYRKSGSLEWTITAGLHQTENISLIEATLQLLNDDDVKMKASFSLIGVYHFHTGAAVLFGTPFRDNMNKSELLPLIRENGTFSETRSLLAEVYDKEIAHIQSLVDRRSYPFIRNATEPIDNLCNLRVFAQFSPIDLGIDMDRVKELEKELDNPTGIPTLYPRPPLLLSAIMYSPNCGFSVQGTEWEGILAKVFHRKSVHFATLVALITFIQTVLVIRQIEYTSTPSMVSKVAYWTIAFQTIIDGYLCLLFLITSILLPSVFFPFVVAAFATYLLAGTFEFQYLTSIGRLQIAERIGGGSAGDASTSPHRPLLLVIISSLGIYWASGMISSVVQESLSIVGIFLVHSFWCPQIFRNAFRGCRKALDIRYVLIMTLSRLLLPLYVYGCPVNLLHNQPNLWIYGLVGWMFLQVLLLLIQERFGSRFCVPRRFLPDVYDYHPLLGPDAGTLESYPGGGGGGWFNRREPVDCAICMSPVDLGIQRAEGDEGRGGADVTSEEEGTFLSRSTTLDRYAYMLTPCQHLFHTPCLENWMRQRLECPICRSHLPPL